MATSAACKKEAGPPNDAIGTHHRSKRLRYTSQRRVKEVRAHLNSDPDVTSDSDNDINSRARPRNKIHDNEEFHLSLPSCSNGE